MSSGSGSLESRGCWGSGVTGDLAVSVCGRGYGLRWRAWDLESKV